MKQQREQYRELPDYNESLGAFEWKLPEDAHPDNFVGDMAVWWIENHPISQPLFLQIGFPGPHPPYDPVPRYAEPYLKKDLSLLEVTQEELDSQPPAYKELRVHNTEVDHDSVVHQLNPTEEQRHRQRAYYCANTTMIDEKVGEIMAALEAQGYLENSVVVFTSDHGDCLTDHGHSQKWTMYDQITRVPMTVWSPGRFKAQHVMPMVQQMDIGPTILELAGVEVPDSLEAVSVLPALEGREFAGRDYVYAEQARDGILTGTKFMTMVRSERWKIVHFLDEPDGQLFDLENDPDELVNLWDDPAHSDQKQEMLAVLREWRIRSQYESAEWCAEWR